ncbi:hypothetical protein BAUCODRAFT_47248, partial [Baudoinia panamericana UAMH 10762]
MCRYHAHQHPCGHLRTIFAEFCPPAELAQRPCGHGEIWATVELELECYTC